MTSLLTGLALCFPLHRSNSPSLDVLSRRPAIASPPPSPPPLHPLFSVLLFPTTTCTFSVAIPHRGAYIDAPMRTLTRARACVARSRTFTQPRIEHRLPALTGRVQRSLADRTVSLYLALVDPRGLSPPLSFSLFLFFSPCLSLSLLHTRSRLAPSIATSLVAPRHHRHFVSRSVSSCLSSFPSVLFPSFSPTYRFLLLLCFPSLPPFLRHTFPPLCRCRYSWSYLSFSLLLSLCSFFVSRTDGDAERNGLERQCGRRRCTHWTVVCTTLDVNGLAREKKRVRRSACERIAGVTDDSLR